MPTLPRILLIPDVPNWIFARHCSVLQRCLSDEFDFTVSCRGERFQEGEFDLIYPLEWVLVEPGQIRNPQKYVTGIRSHAWWPEIDFAVFTRFLASRFQRVHVVSRRLLDIFKPAVPGVVHLSHGIDMQMFTPSTRVDRPGQKLRLGWAGNRSVAAKGFAECIEPLSRIPGVEVVFCGYSDRHLSLDQMREFYDSIDVYVCASDFEGNNNSLLEAAAMQRAILTTDNGTVPEYLCHGESALIVERRLPAFLQAVVQLRNDPDLRVRLGMAAGRSVRSRFDWKDRAEDYRMFFREALANAGRRSPAAAGGEK